MERVGGIGMGRVGSGDGEGRRDGDGDGEGHWHSIKWWLQKLMHLNELSSRKLLN